MTLREVCRELDDPPLHIPARRGACPAPAAAFMRDAARADAPGGQAQRGLLLPNLDLSRLFRRNPGTGRQNFFFFLNGQLGNLALEYLLWEMGAFQQ